MDTFSKRHGFASVEEVEITVRNDAPDGLRQYIVQLAYESGFKPPSKLRIVVCYLLKVAPDKYNWSEYPNIDDEIYELLSSCGCANLKLTSKQYQCSPKIDHPEQPLPGVMASQKP